MFRATWIAMIFLSNFLIFSCFNTLDSKVMMKYLMTAVMNLPQNTTDAVPIGIKIIAQVMVRAFPRVDFATTDPYPEIKCHSTS